MSNAQIEHLSSTARTEQIVEILERDGGVILDRVVDSDALIQLQEELRPYLSAGRKGSNDFAGRQTIRIGALIARSTIARDLALATAVNEVCKAYLGPFCDGHQLHFSQAVSIGPGEGCQPLHRDRMVWGKHVPRSIETQLSTIWAATDFTKENGATQIVPGSHKWESGREPEPSEIAAAEMPAGSVLIYNGSVLHGGGQNQSEDNRLGVLLHYTLNWLRQEENQYLSCPPDIAKTLSPELRSLIGYSQGGFVLGFYSPPGGPGESLELVPPEYMFKERPNGFGRISDQDKP